MRETVIVEHDLDQLLAEGRELLREVKDAEATAAKLERQAGDAREAAQMRRLELGRLLVRARDSMPRRGTAEKGWLAFLKALEIDDSTAHRLARPHDGGPVIDEARIRDLCAVVKAANLEEIETRAELRDALAEVARRRSMLKSAARSLRAVAPEHPALAEFDAALHVAPKATPPIPPLPQRSTIKDRWVYFAQAASGGPVKIGVTGDVGERLKALQCGSPVELRIIAVVAGNSEEETRLHRELAQHRLHGEWFADCDEVRAAMAEATR